VLETTRSKGHIISRETGAAAAAAALRDRVCDVLVFDPSVISEEDFEMILAPLTHGQVPVLLFTKLTPAAARRIVRAAELGAHELVLRGEEHVAQLLAHKLASLYRPSAPAHLLNRAAPHLRRLPDALQTTSVSLFASGPLPRWVDDLAEASGFARRSVDRWMERIGIDGASMLLDTARLARAWEPLVDEKRSVPAVSTRCGYARPRLFVAHARRIVGVPPLEIAAAMSRREFSERLAQALLVH
jgi:AraC-like DNA-binding protein